MVGTTSVTLPALA